MDKFCHPIENHTTQVHEFKYVTPYKQSAPKTTSPMSQSSKNWLGLVKIA